MLLREASYKDELTSLVVESLEKNCPILQDAQFYTKTGPADSVKSKRDGKTDTIFRDLNQNNSATPPVPEYIPVVKKIISFDAKADVILEDRNEDPYTELSEQTRLESEDAGFILQEKFFEANGTEPSLEFHGFRKLVASANSKPVATDGIKMPLGNSDANLTAQQEAIEQLQKLIKTVRGGATHLYMNEFLKIRWLTIAKNLHYYSMSKDELGNEIEKIAGVIIRGAGYKKDGSLLLPFTETVGSATETSSIFAARWGERKDLTALTSVGVRARYAGQSGNFYTNNVNLDMALVLQNKTALYQSKGWYL